MIAGKIDSHSTDLDVSAAKSIPYQFAAKNGAIILSIDERRTLVAVREGFSPFAISEIRRSFGLPVAVRKLEDDEFHKTLEQAYSTGTEGAADFMEDIGKERNLNDLAGDIQRSGDLLDGGDIAPVIRLVNALLSQAARERASDIHFDVFETKFIIKMRVDGVLREALCPPKASHHLVISRLKVMAGLDIAEKRLPQDGRFSLKLAGRSIDARLATIPCAHGERASLRLLDKSAGVINLDRLGMDDTTRLTFGDLVEKSHGVVLVTGPTGSGKSTTLYAALLKIREKRLNIMTVEDPVEYELEGVNQTQVNQRIELTFASALRSILRHDPDVIMIGEIRDFETAKIAVQASLTGHLVLATLHTNDSVAAVTRLTNMGVEPYLLASSLLGVAAQRLIRVLCPSCKERYDWPSAERFKMNREESDFYRPVGCRNCQNSGYAGRTGVFEAFSVDGDLARLIHDQVSERDMRHWLMKNRNLTTLKNAALRLAASGITSPEEALSLSGETRRR
ncbi:MAG: Flp pilus assembly complex ATPase component TadA [Nitrospinae bacterium]|nr:Flp pilus assembly complex ATPase component TadA [Nitrospinota bacterium]